MSLQEYILKIKPEKRKLYFYLFDLNKSAFAYITHVKNFLYANLQFNI